MTPNMPERLIDGVDDPLLLVSGRIVSDANPAALILLGRHIIGQDARIALRHPDAASRLGAPPARVRGVALGGIGAPGSKWEMAITPLGDQLRLVHLADRSDAHHAEAMRVDFVANASHELKTPLANLLGYLETLTAADGPDDPATRARFLSIMQAEAKRMHSLVDDLISLSRIEAEQHRAPETAVELGPLALSIADSIRTAANQPTDTFAVDIAPGLAPVAGDEAQLSQLLHNILGNALKYRRPDTAVDLVLDEIDTGIRLRVTDQGEGIAPEHLPRLTERFYRADPGRSRTLGGTGLGLAIVKHIVERHRGRLDIASTLGAGTTITVVLPTASHVRHGSDI
jgi:two-component system phosphate regulon sensor histidine kinase PhoR